MNIVKYQLAVHMKKAMTDLCKDGISNVSNTNIRVASETPSSIRIEVRRGSKTPRYFEITVTEKFGSRPSKGK